MQASQVLPLQTERKKKKPFCELGFLHSLVNTENALLKTVTIKIVIKHCR